MLVQWSSVDATSTQNVKQDCSRYPTLHGPSMLAVRAKIYGVLYNQASSIAFDETSRYWSALKRS